MMRSIHALGTVNGRGPLCTVPVFLGNQPCLILVARRSSVVVCHQEKHASVVVSIVLGFHVCSIWRKQRSRANTRAKGVPLLYSCVLILLSVNRRVFLRGWFHLIVVRLMRLGIAAVSPCNPARRCYRVLNWHNPRCFRF